MMPRTLLLLSSLLVALCSTVTAAPDTAFSEMVRNYEAIRQALIHDTTAGVPENGQAIQLISSKLAEDFSASSAGVAEPDGPAVRELLPEIAERAGMLAAADGLVAVRAALAELTKPLVRYQALVQGPRPIVVYCPMEKKSWLQPDGPIGNPYAPSMLRCGEVVQR